MNYVYIIRREDEIDVFTDLSLAETWASVCGYPVETEGVIDRETLDAMIFNELREGGAYEQP